MLSDPVACVSETIVSTVLPFFHLLFCKHTRNAKRSNGVLTL